VIASRRVHGEQGASLVIALIFLAVFGLLIPAILNLGTNDLLGTSKLQGQRGSVYAADGATDAAIQYLRRNTGCGRVFGSCPDGNVVTATMNGVTAQATIAALSTDPFKLDRQVRITTTVEGVIRVTATVFIRDSSTLSEQPVDVENWTYTR